MLDRCVSCGLYEQGALQSLVDYIENAYKTTA